MDCWLLRMTEDTFVAFFKASLHDILFVIVRSAEHDVTIFGRKSDNTALCAEILTSPAAPQDDRGWIVGFSE